MSSTESELNQLRNKIDSLDSEIIRLIQDRAKVGSEIGEIKKKTGDPIYRPDREKEVYKKVKSRNPGPLPDSVMVAIYREIMSGTIALEKSIQVGFMGPEGSFSHEATQKKFGSIVDSHAFPSITDVFREVESGKLDYGTVPVENSTEGSVGSTLDNLIQADLNVYSEMYMQISFHLLGFEQDLKKIKKVYGIRIGNEQCRGWIHANLPNVEIIETSSTAMAAKIVSEQKDGVAIASKSAGELYGLDILYPSIEDIPGNTTRFFIIGKDICPPTGNDKTSIVFSVPDQPGSLISALQIFQDYKLNLSKLESRPSRRTLWDYNFFTDFSGHINDPKISEMLTKLKTTCQFIKILGSYPSSPDKL
ncbi:prephenate dehydratase [Leptospira sp. GIMC2001]|uniref:prephenate dehydratase n=1 Tax=Leptospira sp. GIMC2001 TaxID=1513297 RepID=UPI002348F1FF|nr:prephenate dehydratase [Leptospira sp. GIMC2001]WCL48899.1 prephenate dehydratase [Leptospira sp. GIMC2001]